MNETYISILGSLASIAGLILVFREKNVSLVIKALLILVVLLSCLTSYLFLKTSKYESAQYQEIAANFNENLRKNGLQRQAQKILESFPPSANHYAPGENEGIIYSTLAFLELHEETYPRMYELFQTNVLNDIQGAKVNRGTLEQKQIMEQAANASIKLMESIAGGSNNENEKAL